MSYWDGEKTVRFPPRPIEGYPDWILIDCGCCGGIRWGGETPEECKECAGSGSIFLHKNSGVTAQYPGGPFTGRFTPDELKALKL